METGNLSSNRKGSFFKETQTVISLFYLFMVGIGMLFEFHKFRVFNINIFHYADIFDFLIAPFRDYRIFLFVFFTVLMLFILFRMDSLLIRKLPKTYSFLNFGLAGKSWFKTYRIGSFVFLFIFYIILSSLILAKINKVRTMQDSQHVTVTFSDNEMISNW